MSNLDSLPITALEDMELLQRIRQLCDEMQLQTTLLSAGDLSPVPLLRIAIYQNTPGELDKKCGIVMLCLSQMQKI